MAEAGARSEDVLGLKWDRCVQDTFIKFGSGLGLGIIFSVVLFKKKSWPVSLGAGIGLGMGYSNCQHDFQSVYCAHELEQKTKAQGEEII